MQGLIKLLASAAIVTAAATMPAYAKDGDDRGGTTATVDLEARLFYGEKNVSGDFEDSGRSGYRLGAGLGVAHETGGSRLSLDVNSLMTEYFSSGQRDRWSNGIGIGYRRDLGGDLALDLRAAYATQQTGLEYDKFNQAQTRGGLIYEPGNDRVRMAGGYRWRDYADAGDSDGKGYFIDVDYRHKFGNGQAISLDTVYDRINADVASRDYKRFTITPAYAFRISEKLDADVLLRYRTWKYDNRLAGTEKRHDQMLQPTVRFSYEVARDWDVSGEAAWRWRWSNDSAIDEHGPRAAIGINKRFRVKD